MSNRRPATPRGETLPDTAVATLVAANAVDKLAALTVISLAVDSPIRDAATSRPHIVIADGVWVQIDIPKFGEPPPVAIDVHAVAGVAAAEGHALELMRVLRTATAWSLSAAFDAAA